MYIFSFFNFYDNIGQHVSLGWGIGSGPRIGGVNNWLGLEATGSFGYADDDGPVVINLYDISYFQGAFRASGIGRRMGEFIIRTFFIDNNRIGLSLIFHLSLDHNRGTSNHGGIINADHVTGLEYTTF